MTNGETDQLISEIEKISAEAQTTFGRLSVAQINWKPSAESWSIGQCFDHLIKTNSPFFGELDEIVKGKHQNPFWGKLPFLSDIFAGFVINAVTPENVKKTKNPAVFSPSSSDVSANIIGDFVAHQRKIVEYMRATRELDLTKIVITSPIAVFVTYRLSDGYKIIALHERRHFQQAEKVLRAENFPAN